MGCLIFKNTDCVNLTGVRQCGFDSTCRNEFLGFSPAYLCRGFICFADIEQAATLEIRYDDKDGLIPRFF